MLTPPFDTAAFPVASDACMWLTVWLMVWLAVAGLTKADDMTLTDWTAMIITGVRGACPSTRLAPH